MWLEMRLVRVILEVELLEGDDEFDKDESKAWQDAFWSLP